LCLDESFRNWIKLAIEELFTNMVRHNEGGGEGIEIRMDVREGHLEIQLVDDDVDPFDPSTVPEVRLDAQIEDRRAGGLGLHLVKAIVDEIKYDYQIPWGTLKDLVHEYKRIVKQKMGASFPENPMDQIWGSIGAVFSSWDNPRAEAYRELNGIPSD